MTPTTMTPAPIKSAQVGVRADFFFVSTGAVGTVRLDQEPHLAMME